MQETDLIELAEQRRMAAIRLAERDYNLHMALIATKFGSALETLADLGKATEGSAQFDWPLVYMDAPSVALGVGIDGIKVTIENIPGVGHDLTFIELGLNNVTSDQVSAFAADVKKHPTLGRDASRLFVRYKGGGLYRYLPYPYSYFADLVKIVRQMSQALPVTLTVGEYVNRVVKQGHEIGKVICEKFNPASSTWEVVLTNAQRKQGKESIEVFEQIVRDAQDFALLVHRELGGEGSTLVVDEHMKLQGSVESLNLGSQELLSETNETLMPTTECPQCGREVGLEIREDGPPIIADHGVGEIRCSAVGREYIGGEVEEQGLEAAEGADPLALPETTELDSGTGIEELILETPQPEPAPEPTPTPETPPEQPEPEGSTVSETVPHPQLTEQKVGEEATF